MTKKTLLISGSVAVVSLVLATGIAAAQGTGKTTLVDKIAQRFNLNKADVQQVFDQNKQERQANRETKYVERLNKAVTDGKLTAAQKDQVLAKHKELVAFMSTLKDKTPAERHAAIKQKRTEIEAWEKQNNIPAGHLGFGGRGFGRSKH